MAEKTVKQLAHEILDRMPAGMTWDEFQDEVSFMVSIQNGPTDHRTFQPVTIDVAREQFGLPPLPAAATPEPPAEGTQEEKT